MVHIYACKQNNHTQKKRREDPKRKKFLAETFIRAGLSTDRPAKKPHSPQN